MKTVSTRAIADRVHNGAVRWCMSRRPLLDLNDADLLFWTLVIAACLAWIAAGVVLLKLS